MQLYLLASFALDALATAAQGLVSAAAGPRDVTGARAASVRIAQLALMCGAVLGIGLGVLNGQVAGVRAGLNAFKCLRMSSGGFPRC